MASDARGKADTRRHRIAVEPVAVGNESGSPRNLSPASPDLPAPTGRWCNFLQARTEIEVIEGHGCSLAVQTTALRRRDRAITVVRPTASSHHPALQGKSGFIHAARCQEIVRVLGERTSNWRAS